MKTTKINVLEHQFDIRFEPPGSWAENGMGRCSFKHGNILINNQMPHDVQQGILMHELIHLIGEMNSIELTEQTTDGLALGMLSIIKSNPQFIHDCFFGVESQNFEMSDDLKEHNGTCPKCMSRTIKGICTSAYVCEKA